MTLVAVLVRCECWSNRDLASNSDFSFAPFTNSLFLLDNYLTLLEDFKRGLKMSSLRAKRPKVSCKCSANDLWRLLAFERAICLHGGSLFLLWLSGSGNNEKLSSEI